MTKKTPKKTNRKTSKHNSKSTRHTKKATRIPANDGDDSMCSGSVDSAMYEAFVVLVVVSTHSLTGLIRRVLNQGLECMRFMSGRYF